MEQSPASRRFTTRFVAGKTLTEALEVARELRQRQIMTSLDYLGENVTSVEEARGSYTNYRDALECIGSYGLPATVSIKLTQFGLDFAHETCVANVGRLVARAAELNSVVEFDMESTEFTDRTLEIVFDMHRAFPGHVRAVIQAYLRRSLADVRNLSSEKIPIRLCKGAYREPVAMAYQQKRDVNHNYMELMMLLLSKGTYPAIASHDEAILNTCLEVAEKWRTPPESFEFQMLYGIRRDLQQRIVARGYRLRLYVPYGTAWYPYFMRRLAERPANLWFVARNLVRA